MPQSKSARDPAVRLRPERFRPDINKYEKRIHSGPVYESRFPTDRYFTKPIFSSVALGSASSNCNNIVFS